MLDFIVLGLPRSGTTWLANWLTTDTSLCVHDPFAQFLPDELHTLRDGRTLGISCTGAYLLPNWLATQACPIAVIERPHQECSASLQAIGFPAVTPSMRDALNRAPGRRFSFSAIWNEQSARQLWGFLLPHAKFDVQRYRLLSQIQVQPKMSKFRYEPRVLEALKEC